MSQSAVNEVPRTQDRMWHDLGIPEEIVALRAELRPAVAEKLATIETYLLPLDQATPEAHRRKLAAQIDLWGPIIEKAGIQAE